MDHDPARYRDMIARAQQDAQRSRRAALSYTGHQLVSESPKDLPHA